MSRIDEFFYSIIPPQLMGTTYGSSHTMRKKLREMEEIVGVPKWHAGVVTYTISGQQEFFHRDILECIQYLLKQKAFAQHWKWQAKKEVDHDNVRQYHEMYTGDWWPRIEVSCTPTADKFCTCAFHTNPPAYRINSQTALQ